MPKDGGTNGPRPQDGAIDAAADRCPDEMTLASYLDGRLSGDEEAVMALHLARCRKCATAVAELRELIAGIDSGVEDEDEARAAAERAKKIIDG